MSSRASIAIVLCACAARAPRAQGPRTVEAHGGIVVTAAPRDHLDELPGIALGVRYYRGWLWLGANASVEPTLDLSNGEQADAIVALAIGPGAGAFVDLGRRVTLLGGARLDAVTAGDDWPGATGRVYGVRFGPTASALITLGHPFGHAMGVELRGSWFAYEMNGGASPSLWQIGVLASGVLFPEPVPR